MLSTIRSGLRPILALSMASRGLRRDPSSSLLAIGILALGLALPATFFSFLVGGMRPLPVPEGNRVVRVDMVQPQRDGRPLTVLGEDVVALQGSSALSALGGFQTFGGTLVDRGRAATRVSGAALTPQVLPLLRAEPEVGRFPSTDEAGSTVLLGHDVWMELYDGDAGVLGRTVELQGTLRTVVGVLPEGFGFPFKQNTWVLVNPADALQEPFELVGRLAPDATLEAATAELDPRWERGDAIRGPDRAGGRLTVKSYTGGRGENGEAMAFGGLVLVALCLLLIACANVANLLLLRATERVRALGIQAALGAGRLQIGVQLFLESLILAALGGGIGLVIADATVNTVQRTLAAEHFGYYWMRMAVDGPVLVFTAVLVMGTALVAGLLPVVRVLRVDVQRVLKEEGVGVEVGGGGSWSRAFVTLQLALSCGAVVAAALTGLSLAGSRDFGGDLPDDQILTAAVDLPAEADGAARELHLHALEASLAARTGARAAALALAAPGYFEKYSRVEVQGETLDPRSFTLWNAVTPSYLAALGITLRAGRAFTPGDDADAPRVALVSESFARRYSPGEPVLGRTVRLTSADSTTWLTVVGVVADVDLGVGAYVRADRVLVPLDQVSAAGVMILLRADGDATALAPALREAVAEVDPGLPVSNVRTLADGHAFIIRIPRALAAMALSGGAAGLLVAAVGLYGLLAFRVRQRRRELGVRLALGADGARLARDILEMALRQLVPAVAVGLALAWVAAPALQVMLMGKDPRAPLTYVGVGLGFILAGLAAAALPALRAGAVEPAAVLRGE
jgi:predicted permease